MGWILWLLLFAAAAADLVLLVLLLRMRDKMQKQQRTDHKALKREKQELTAIRRELCHERDIIGLIQEHMVEGILILDDSVSAVDTRTEKIILDNLKSSRANKTTLLIAHRISTVERLDKIIFLDDGKIEAVGPHDELYTSCPKYRRMVDLQRLEDEAGGDDNA